MDAEPVSKIEFDKDPDFKFQAAYGAYSDLFNEMIDSKVRCILNDNVSKLFNNEISYPQFYKAINHYRENSGRTRRFHRTKIRGKRKWAYRRDQQEKNRQQRHKR